MELTDLAPAVRRILAGGLIALISLIALNSRVTLAQPDADVVRVRATRVALTNVKIIDGTGGPAADDRALVIDNGTIAAVGPSAAIKIPADAQVVDLRGHTVLPGLVGMHDHLFYAVPPGLPDEYVSTARSFPRLYLASGVTTLRTAGTMDVSKDAAARRRIDRGEEPGPTLHLTSQYFHRLEGPPDGDRIRRLVDEQARAGATSFKAYTSLRTDELDALVKRAHEIGAKVTGHLCAVSFKQAAELGIDNIEHGLWTDSGLVRGIGRDYCPDASRIALVFMNLTVQHREIVEIISTLVERRVAITSTLAILESLAARSEAVDVRMRIILSPEVHDKWQRASIARAERRAEFAPWETVLKQEMAFERAFVAAGGRLMAGSDPTGWGVGAGGFMDQRNVELLVEAGFEPVEAIRIASANGAAFLGEADRIGTIAPGKQADLVVVRGDPASRIADIRNVVVVFKNGVGYDSARLIESVAGMVGESESGPVMRLIENLTPHSRTQQMAMYAGAAILLVILLTSAQTWTANRKRARRNT